MLLQAVTLPLDINNAEKYTQASDSAESIRSF